LPPRLAPAFRDDVFRVAALRAPIRERVVRPPAVRGRARDRGGLRARLAGLRGAGFVAPTPTAAAAFLAAPATAPAAVPMAEPTLWAAVPTPEATVLAAGPTTDATVLAADPTPDVTVPTMPLLSDSAINTSSMNALASIVHGSG
jgi:hypothetical protein